MPDVHDDIIADDERRMRELYEHLREAARLADELHDVLPVASPGRGYLEWEQLQWMADAVHDGTKGEQR